MKRAILTTLLLTSSLSLSSVSAFALEDADVCKNSPPPTSFIVVKEASVGTSIAKGGNEYEVTTTAPQVTFLTDDPCTKQKLAKVSSGDYNKVNKLLHNYDRYAVMTGNKGETIMIAKVKNIQTTGNTYHYDVVKMWGKGDFVGKIPDLKVFLMEVEYKDILFLGA